MHKDQKILKWANSIARTAKSREITWKDISEACWKLRFNKLKTSNIEAEWKKSAKERCRDVDFVYSILSK